MENDKELSLKGKIAFVTGSSKNLGVAIAVSLAEKGASVIIHYNSSKKEAEEAFSKAKSLSENSILVKCNVENSYEVKSLFSKIEKSMESLTFS